MTERHNFPTSTQVHGEVSRMGPPNPIVASPAFSSLYMYLFILTVVAVKVHACKLLVVILSLMNPVHNVPPFLSKPHFSILNLRPTNGLLP
jgi:hypothetical protein